jgi:hypothetical protein
MLLMDFEGALKEALQRSHNPAMVITSLFIS